MNAKERILYCSILNNMRNQIDTLLEVISTSSEGHQAHRPGPPVDSHYLGAKEEAELGKMVVEATQEDVEAVQLHFAEIRQAQQNVDELVFSGEPDFYEPPVEQMRVPTPNLDQYQRQRSAYDISDDLLGIGGDLNGRN